MVNGVELASLLTGIPPTGLFLEVLLSSVSTFSPGLQPYVNQIHKTTLATAKMM